MISLLANGIPFMRLTNNRLRVLSLQANKVRDAGADLVELRIDLLDPAERPKWKMVLEQSPLDVIVTNRASWEGGNSTEPETDRLSYLLEAAKAGAGHIDVELAAFPDFKELVSSHGLSLPFPSTKLILSHHNFERPLSESELQSIIRQMSDASADVAKIAMKATSALDNVLVFRTLKKATMPMIVLAMGELGQVSRIVAPRFGAYLTFASVGAGKESAPGQVDTATLANLYRFRSINSDTPMYGVIGNPVSHSMSPAVHNTALQESGTPGVYVPLKVEDDFASFISQMTGLGFDGFSVTIPGKLPAMKAMDEIDPVAEKIGAMNTVVKRADGTLKGYNTDWIAAISAIAEQSEGGLQGKTAICIGAGGAGRALAFGALEKGCRHVTVVNRTKEKAVQLANDLGPRASGMSLEEFNDGQAGEYDVLMNSTSVGMHPRTENSPVDRSVLICGSVVFDAVYNPLETKFLREAREAGCVTVSGLEMFVRQAAEQFHLWFPDAVVPTDKMRAVVLEALRK